MRDRVTGSKSGEDASRSPSISHSPSPSRPPPIPTHRQRHRQEALWQAFDALDDEGTGRLPRELVAHVLQRLKPKYSQTKIHVRDSERQ